MHPSDPARVATRVEVLPDAGREEQLERWGLSGSARWSEVDRRPRSADSASVEMPGDPYGTDGWDLPAVAERDLEELGFLRDGGWTVVDTSRGTARDTGFTPGARDAGMTSHRGVLHPDEYVDKQSLQDKIEEALGFTYDDIRSVYRQGRLSSTQREIRCRIDARLLALSRSGANMALLARLLGMTSDGNRMAWVVRKALARARASEAVVA